MAHRAQLVGYRSQSQIIHDAQYLRRILCNVQSDSKSRPPINIDIGPTLQSQVDQINNLRRSSQNTQSNPQANNSDNKSRPPINIDIGPALQSQTVRCTSRANTDRYPVYIGARNDTTFISPLANLYSYVIEHPSNNIVIGTPPTYDFSNTVIGTPFAHDFSNNSNIIARLPIRKRCTNEKFDQCAICLQEWANNDENLKTLPCFHYFHEKCIDTWLKTTMKCPICRNNVRIDDSESNSDALSLDTPLYQTMD